MFSLSLFSQFFVQTYKNIIFGTLWCIWQLFVLNSLFHDFGSFFIDGESCIGIYPPSLSLLSLSPLSLSYIFIFLHIRIFFNKLEDRWYLQHTWMQHVYAGWCGCLILFLLIPWKENQLSYSQIHIHLRAAIQVRHLLCECVRRENWKFCESWYNY